MSISIQSLRERKSVRAKELHDLLDNNKGDAWKSEHQEIYNKTMSEIEDINAEISRVEAYLESVADEEIDNSLQHVENQNTGKDGKINARGLYCKWLRGGDKSLTAEDWTSIRATMSTTTDSEGGYTVQTEVAAMIADALKKFGGMRRVANVLQSSNGNPINYPNSDGTSETGEQIAENTTATGADLVFGTTLLTTYKFSSKVVAVPFELIQDSQIDIETLVNKRLIQRLGRITNTKFTVGTGTGESKGIVPNAGSGKVGTTGQTVTVIFDDLVDLVHSVDEAYREEGNCRFMMNDASLKIIRKLKDSNGRPIFLPGYDGLSGPMPDTLLGYEIVTNSDVVVMAANAKSILFGDYYHYIIRDVMDMTLFRFTDSAYAKLGQVGFLMWMRSGGAFTDVGGAVKYYQNSAT